MFSTNQAKIMEEIQEHTEFPSSERKPSVNAAKWMPTILPIYCEKNMLKVYNK